MANEFRIKNGLIVGNTKQMFFNGTTGKLTIGNDLTSTIDETVRDEALLHIITNNDDSDGDGVVSYDMIIERLMGDADSPNEGPNLVLMSSNTDDSGSGSTDMIDDTNIGNLLWRAHTDSSEANFGLIRVNIQDASNTAKDSKMFFKVQKANTITEFLTLDGGSDKVVVPNSGFQIGSGATVTTIATSTSLSTSNTTLSTTGAIKSYVDSSVGSAGGGDITAVTAGDGLTGGASTGAATLTVGAGNGITVNTNDVAVTAAQTTITSVLNASLVAGRDAHNQIKFSTDDQIIFRVGNADGVTFKASGEIEATKFDGALEGNADTATALATARAINGVNFDGTGDITVTAAGSTLSDTVTVAKGGSGQTSYTNGQLLIGNTTGNTLAKATLTAGSGISVTNGAGSITIAATGGGGASDLDGLSDAKSGGTDFANSLILGHQTTGTLSSAEKNVGIGYGALDAITSAIDTVAIGYNAGTALTNAQGNTMVGTQAGEAVSAYESGTLGRGSYTTMVGYQAGQAMTTGGRSTFIGWRAGLMETTGAYNTYVGASSGLYARGGDKNTGIGYYAGSGTANYQSASNNTSLGYRALHGITSGNDNLAIGVEAGDDITTGVRNIAIGNFALDAADAENDNIAIGYDALGGAVAGGEKNIAIGNYAADALTTADDLVAIGYNAAGSLTTGYNDNANSVIIGNHAAELLTNGSDNVIIGHEAGKSMTTWSSGTLRNSYSVIIGNKAGYSLANSGRNIAIGHQSLFFEQDTGYNTYVGQNAGYYQRGAEKNTGMGYNVMQGSIYLSGDENVGLGYRALYTLGSGANNIAIGCEAGDNITTGSNNVVIGKADVPSATGDDQLSISSGDGGVTWITGDSDGGIASKAQVVAVTGTTQLTEAQSGSYVYVTGSGAVELPDNAKVGLQYTIFNNKGSSLTVTLGTNNSIVSNWATNAAVADNEATSYVCVSAGNWVQIG